MPLGGFVIAVEQKQNNEKTNIPFHTAVINSL
ncbi:hypothetical protein FHT22_002704 [Pedobacter sp. SG918]|nr:hypothetical protein [Pedobacter sp. SG918]